MKSPQPATSNWQLTARLVGREAELAQLHKWLDKALNGKRQIIFVTGEPGIGKTALVEAFLLGIGGWGLGVSSPLPQAPVPNPQPLSSGSAAGSASSTTALGKLICRC